MGGGATENSDAARLVLRALASHAGRDADDGERELAALDVAGGVFVVDAGHRIVHMNASAAEIAAVSARDAIGSHCRDVFRCVDCPTPCPLFTHGRVRGRELLLESNDGRRTAVLKNGNALLDDSGRLLGGVEILQNITALRSAHDRQLTRAAARGTLVQDALCAALESAAIVVSADGKIAAITRAAAAMLRLDVRTAESCRIADLICSFDGGPPMDTVHRARVPIVLTAMLRSGTTGRLRVCVTPISARRPGGAGVLLLLDPSPEAEPVSSFHGIVGRTSSLKQLIAQIAAFAHASAPVLIVGESGSGKKLLARALHEAGPRAKGPFHAISCAAIPEPLLESELFGFVRASGHRDKGGHFEASADGTLFLEEIECLSPRMQAKILSVLETRPLEPVGSTRAGRPAARVITATAVDLAAMVREGSFRTDLLYRLNALTLHTPPLRDRRQDIAVLARHFAAVAAAAHGTPARAIEDDAIQALEEHDWPGNVRELQNAINYANAVARDGCIRRNDLPPEVTAQRAGLATGSPGEVTRRSIEDALQAARFNRAAAAALLGVSRTTLWRRMRELGLS